MDDNDLRPSPEPAGAGDLAWQALFEGSSPRAILARLVEGDPLGMRDRCQQRIRNQALLLDTHRLHLRSVAHVARHAPSYRGSPTLDIWIAERIRKALGELLEEDTSSSLAGEQPFPPSDERLMTLADLLEIDPMVLSRGTVGFNRSPYEVRRTFVSMVLEAQSPAEYARLSGLSLERARAALRRGFWILGVRADLDLDDLLSEDEGGGDRGH